MPNININNLKVKYKIKRNVYVDAINDLNITFKKNKFNVLIGYSGCGKSTLLKAIAGLIPYEGTIKYDNLDASTLPVYERELSLVSQSFTLYPHLTIFDNIAYPLKLLNMPKEEIINKVNEIAKRFHIEHCLTRKPKQLSGGQQQRTCLAKALIKNPSICLFDEPLANLDEKLKREIRLLIKKEFKSKNMTIVYVTHNLEEAMVLADYLYVMENGSIVLNDTPLNIYNSSNELILNLKKEEEMKNEFIRQ